MNLNETIKLIMACCMFGIGFLILLARVQPITLVGIITLVLGMVLLEIVIHNNNKYYKEFP